MRGFQCYYYKLDQKGNLVRNTNISCWYGLKNESYYDSNNNYAQIDSKNQHFIFIKDFKEPEVSDESINRIIQLINNITTCEIVTIDNIKYIKYKLLGTYAQNLLLLNFIRMLWYKPSTFNHENFIKSSIFNSARGIDSLKFLLKCVKNNVINSKHYMGYGAHSCIYKDIKLKTKKDLLAYKGDTIEAFLTT